ncbi:MAG: ABC transporter permease [Candidatus Eremiobacteraeota bacterium]|nr:ABC transporter permease [Candidatus Eremiobacteraeota bacterium]
MISYFIEALDVLRANRLRTILALLGLIVGVGAVIAIQVLGQATSGATVGIVKGLNPRTFLIFPDLTNGFDRKMGYRDRDLQGLAALANVEQAIPYYPTTLNARVGHTVVAVSVSATGSGDSFLAEPLAEGRPITEDEVARRALVAVLSDGIAKKLAPDGQDLIGTTIRVGDFHYTVVGILQAPPSGAVSQDLTPDVGIPYTTFEQQILRGERIYYAQVAVRNPNEMSGAEDDAKAYLKHLSDDKFEYRTIDLHLFASVIGKVFGVLTFVVGAIGAISLVVAGIGIMNILLVSITERTREIGVRKAIGARRGQVLFQFFLEASILAFVGCLAGALFGLAAGWYVNTHYIIKLSGIIVALPWVQAIVLAVVFAAIVTLAFGTYPAYRAAGMDPIEALRYE